MQKPTVANLTVTENPEWRIANKDLEYTKVIVRLGSDIIDYSIESDHDVSLASMDMEMLYRALRDSNLAGKSFCLLWNMKHVTGMSLVYKKELAQLLYNPTVTPAAVVVYNVRPEFAMTVETITAMIPDTMTAIIAGNREDAISKAVEWRKTAPVENGSDNEYLRRKKEFLACLGRISWLNMTNQHIEMPHPDDQLYPFFKAVESLQEDICENMTAREGEIEKIAADLEKQLTEKNILLNAQKELYRKLKDQFEKEKSALQTRISTQEMELTRISTAIAEKTSSLKELLDIIGSLDIDTGQKNVLMENCRNMIETEMIEKRLNIELTTTDSEFLSRLQKKHPNLNQRELRICLLIKLNYSTQEIARSVGISTRGMESIRYRMHKKIDLSKHQSLKSYLTDLAVATANQGSRY